MHVEQDNKQSQKVQYQVLQRLWHALPSELCCKWFRVLADSGDALSEEVTEKAFKQLVCGVDLPMLGKQGFNCFEALFGEINSRSTATHQKGRMQISGRQVGAKISLGSNISLTIGTTISNKCNKQVVHKGIKISGQVPRLLALLAQKYKY